MTNIDLEIKVIERFIIKTKRDRYLTFIKNTKTRDKFLKELAHFKDLKKDLFEELKSDERKKIKEKLNRLRNIKDCYIISENSKLDSKRLDFETALNEIIGHGMGTIVVFGHAEIVYYEGEGPNYRYISK
jgi:hypothetical protein